MQKVVKKLGLGKNEKPEQPKRRPYPPQNPKNAEPVNAEETLTEEKENDTDTVKARRSGHTSNKKVQKKKT